MNQNIVDYHSHPFTIPFTIAMSNSTSQTSSMSQVSDNLQQHTTPGGIYDQLIDKISNLGNLTLAGANYCEHFYCTVTERGNYKYIVKNDMDKHDNAPDCHLIIFGQTCPMSLGTQLSCRGNNVNYKVCEQYYNVEKNTLTLNQNEKIRDDSIVKHCIVLAQPSLCDERLQILYQNQLATLDSIRDEDATEEYNTHKVHGFLYISSMALTLETEEVHDTELVSFTNKQEYRDQ